MSTEGAPAALLVPPEATTPQATPRGRRACFKCIAMVAVVVCGAVVCTAWPRLRQTGPAAPHNLTAVHGYIVDARFMPLLAAFRATLHGHEGTGIKAAGEGGGGASFAMYHRGRLVVDLWAGDAGVAAPVVGGDAQPAGMAPSQAEWVSEGRVGRGSGTTSDGSGGATDTTTAWQSNTAAYMFSGTKGLAAIAIAKLVDDGHLRYEDPVAKYWPEFGRAGKRNVSVAQILAHSAGMSALDRYVRQSPLQWASDAGEHMSRMHPVWNPGAKVGYAPWAVGTVVAELVPRVDPLHRPVDMYFDQEVAAPLGLRGQILLGRRPLPGSNAPNQPLDLPVAKFRYAGLSTWLPAPFRIPHAIRHATVPSSLSWRAFANPLGDPLKFNTRPWQAAMLPNCNGYATARALAKVYAALATSSAAQRAPNPGVVPALLRPTTLRRAAFGDVISGTDQVMLMATAFGMGFVRCSRYFPMDLGPDDDDDATTCGATFGHPGFGGALAWADADAELAVAYLPSVLDPDASARSVRFATLRAGLSRVTRDLRRLELKC